MEEQDRAGQAGREEGSLRSGTRPWRQASTSRRERFVRIGQSGIGILPMSRQIVYPFLSSWFPERRQPRYQVQLGNEKKLTTTSHRLVVVGYVLTLTGAELRRAL